MTKEGRNKHVRFARSCLPIRTQSRVIAIEYFIQDGHDHFLIDEGLVGISAEDLIELIRPLRLR